MWVLLIISPLFGLVIVFAGRAVITSYWWHERHHHTPRPSTCDHCFRQSLTH